MQHSVCMGRFSPTRADGLESNSILFEQILF